MRPEQVTESLEQDISMSLEFALLIPDLRRNVTCLLPGILLLARSLEEPYASRYLEGKRI